MIYHYGVTTTGAYHVKNGTVCQDAHCFERIDDRFAIGAVADGLGSEEHSDIASKIASKESVRFCMERIDRKKSPDEILSIIKDSFAEALKSVEQTAKDNGHSSGEYDTTLALAVFLDGNVYFGNSGDSGIIVAAPDGRYEALTKQQRDEDGCVFPLCSGPGKWVFGEKREVASILLATDGIYETFFPVLLKNSDQTMYIALAHYLMSDESLGFSAVGEDRVGQNMKSFIESIPEAQVNDDKTVLVMLDSSVTVSKKPDAYYAQPDWVKLRKEREKAFRREAYPSLYKNEMPNNSESTSAQEETVEIKSEPSIEEKDTKESLIKRIKKHFSKKNGEKC